MKRVSPNHVVLENEAAFTLRDNCEVCGKDAALLPTGVCRACYGRMIRAKADPTLRAMRLKELQQSENGVIQHARRMAASQTTQREVEVVSQLEKRARQEEQGEMIRFKRVLEATPTELAELRPPNVLDIEVATLNTELFAYLQKNSHKLYELSPRRFEELTAEILHDMGCEVQLTPATRDGGRDILAWFNKPFGKFLTIVECKRYSPERKIGIDIVERFLYTITQKDRASCGLLATTSFFSSEVKAVAREHAYQLQLADFHQMKEWVGQYGRWSKTEQGRLWVPPA